jgi:hypothetical protein
MSTRFYDNKRSSQVLFGVRFYNAKQFSVYGLNRSFRNSQVDDAARHLSCKDERSIVAISRQQDSMIINRRLQY